MNVLVIKFFTVHL